MANKAPAPDALDRYLKNRFPTANPTVGVEAPAFKPDNGADTADAAYQQVPRNGNPPVPAVGSGGDSGGGGGGGGSGSGDSTAPAQPLDWHAYLTNWGFTQDIVDELDRIFRTYSDPNQASAAALAYVRGTDWYKVTFPGISEGLSKGVISNEADYRAYTNQLNDLYTRYYGRNVTGAEVAQRLGAGYNVNRVGQALGGEAWAKVNGQETQYELGAFDSQGQATPDQLQALGEENAGLDSLLGQQLQDRLAKAQKRLQGVMQGTLATPSMQLLTGGRLASPSLQGGISNTDVGS